MLAADGDREEEGVVVFSCFICLFIDIVHSLILRNLIVLINKLKKTQ